MVGKTIWRKKINLRFENYAQKRQKCKNIKKQCTHKYRYWYSKRVSSREEKKYLQQKKNSPDINRYTYWNFKRLKFYSQMFVYKNSSISKSNGKTKFFCVSYFFEITSNK